jgi:hypothetical protein
MNQFATAARTPKAHLLIEMDQLGNRDCLVLSNQQNGRCKTNKFHNRNNNCIKIGCKEKPIAMSLLD